MQKEDFGNPWGMEKDSAGSPVCKLSKALTLEQFFWCQDFSSSYLYQLKGYLKANC